MLEIIKSVGNKFRLGQLVMTGNAQDRLDQLAVARAVERHSNGDWGNLDNEDRQANERALIEGERLMSVYGLEDDPDRFWIITEADRSVTTVLMPEDY